MVKDDARLQLALRPTKGLIDSVIAFVDLDLAVPDHTTLSRGAETLKLSSLRSSDHPCTCWWIARGFGYAAKKEFLVQRLCKVAGVSESGYFAWKDSAPFY